MRLFSCNDLEGWKHREIAEKLNMRRRGLCALTSTMREDNCGST